LLETVVLYGVAGGTTNNQVENGET